jgi:DNA adenine methylase
MRKTVIAAKPSPGAGGGCVHRRQAPPGGGRLVRRIELLAHSTYAEPFVGMGGVFLRRGFATPLEIERNMIYAACSKWPESIS